HAAALSRLSNLTVIDFAPDELEAALPLLTRGARLTAMVQDGELQLMDAERSLTLQPRVRQAGTAK
ncbi:MAG TPA: YaeQ family protein, partial [Lysobacter sp.]